MTGKKYLFLSSLTVKRYLFSLVLMLSMLQVTAQTNQGLKAPLTFFIANDLGRNGYHKQKPIAELMGEMADTVGPECIIAAGDIHHFMGVESTQDPLWLSNYEQVYSHPELMIPWLPVCGNHEYRGNTQAVLDYSNISRRWQMPAKYYTRTYEKKGTSVRLVWLDTTPLIQRYRHDPVTYPDACKEDAQKQLAWLDSVLTVAREQWVVVIGHHPIYAETNKSQEEQTDMQQTVGKVLGRHKVDMYVCGHIHNFQHIRKAGSDIDYVVNSSPSLARKVKPIDGTQFCSPDEGFSVLSVGKNALKLSMINYEGKVIYQIVKGK